MQDKSKNSYLKKSVIEPKGTSVIHITLFDPFIAFVMNDGFMPQGNDRKLKAIFIKPNKQYLEISPNGKMNEHAQIRYIVFLKEYLKRGAPFILKLRAQIVKRSSD